MDPLRSFFENLALEWDAFQPIDREVRLNQLFEPFDTLVQTGASILDVGTGTGAVIPIIQNRYPGARITSVDLAAQMLAGARQRVPDAQLVQADVHALPFADKHFAAAICHNSFPHFRQKPAALQELRRVLEPAGKLLILHEAGRVAVNAIHQTASAEIIHQDLLPPGQTLYQMLVEAGYRPLCIEDNDVHYVASAQVQSGE